MKITTTQFEKFWTYQGHYLGIDNPARFKENILEKIDILGDSELLDAHVCGLEYKDADKKVPGLKKGRESTRKIIVEFYDYLISHEKCTELKSSCLFNKRFFDYPFERQLEIAKFLHESRTDKEIEKEFDIDERTRRKDLQELEKGITVLGSTIRVKKEKKGNRSYYRATVHPIFLALNLTEVYALTVYLDRVLRKNTKKREKEGKDDQNADMVRDISERIKLQLSDYAFSALFKDQERPRIRNEYHNDEEYAKKYIQMYLMKREGMLCKLIWQGKQYIGAIRWVKELQDYRVVTDKGEVLDADLEDVDFIVDDLEYI
jgi:hypothetical protein